MSDIRIDPCTRFDRDRLAATFGRIVARADRARTRRGLPPAQVLLRAPGVEFASGDRSRQFHSASVAKTLTAIRVLQLHERGALDLDAPIPTLLPDTELRGLFVVNGVDRASEVTPRLLLEHRSGAGDYFEDRSDAAVPFPRLVAAEPDHLWQPAELLDFARSHQRPVAEPGRRFHYSSTGYVLLGRIIEEVGAADWGRQLHDAVLTPSGMDDSCLWLRTLPGGASCASPADAARIDLAPMRIDDDQISGATSLSCDWGGGGLATTLDDLTRFTSAWTSGALVSAVSWACMTDARRRVRPGIRYGAGTMQLRYDGFFPLLRGMPRPVGHLGLTGVHAFTAPERGIHLAMNFHSTREMSRSFQVHIGLMRALLAALSR